LQALQHESAALADTEEQLAVANEQLAAPSTLGAHARALGMVPTGSIAYVDLHHHGKIVGVVRAAAPPPPAAPTPSPSASAATKATAKSNAAGPSRTAAKSHHPKTHQGTAKRARHAAHRQR
jgi:hypothetical protein